MSLTHPQRIISVDMSSIADLNDDVLRLIISMIPHSALLPVMMTCKRLHDMADSTRDKSRERLESRASHYCMTNSMVSWALSMGCPHMLIMNGCALYGRIQQMEFLIRHRTHTEDPTHIWDTKTYNMAARGGHLDVLRWLRSQNPPCPWGAVTCREAARCGHLDVLKWLRAQDPPCPWNAFTCEMAAMGGHFDVLKWLRAQDPPCPWDTRTYDYGF